MKTKIIKATKQEMQGTIEALEREKHNLSVLCNKFENDKNIYKCFYLEVKSDIEKLRQDAETDSKIKHEQNQQISDLRDTRTELKNKIDELEKELAKRIEDNKIIEQEIQNLSENCVKLINHVLQQGNTMNKLSSLIK